MWTSEALEHDAVSAATPGEPRWILSSLYAAAMTAALAWVGWPGLMSYDSLYAYREAKLGIETMLWPPMHAYLFWLSQSAGADAWGLLILQIGLLFFSAAVAINLLVRSWLWAGVALAAFAFTFAWVPKLMGEVIVHWRDVTTTSFATAGLAAWLLAARYRAKSWLAAAAALLGIAAALRYNTTLLLVA